MPTVFTHVTQNMKIAREEIFGPVSCIMEHFNSDDKVIELANDNVYGLTSWVWTKDMARGMRFANEIQAGTVVLGQGRAGDPNFPGVATKRAVSGKRVLCTAC
jgi:acyl-CoA reductase-like NAD-dependent aldehyde dehydrogenase